MKTVSMYDHGDYNCFICCILSHGAVGAIYGTDGKTVPIKDLTDYFTPANCSTLRGKPKLFFVQACQGTGKQTGCPRTSILSILPIVLKLLFYFSYILTCVISLLLGEILIRL